MTVVDSMRDAWAEMQRKAEAARPDPELPLHGGHGGGTSGLMVPLKDYVDARDEAVESRLTAKLDTLATKGTIWGAVGTALAIGLAVLAFGGDRFDSGIGIADQRQEQLKRDAEQDRKFDEILKRLPPSKG